MDGRASPGRLVLDLAGALLGAGASFVSDLGKEHRLGGCILEVRDSEADGENSRGGGQSQQSQGGRGGNFADDRERAAEAGRRCGSSR
jgi:general stress protein YciG